MHFVECHLGRLPETNQMGRQSQQHQEAGGPPRVAWQPVHLRETSLTSRR